MRPRDVGYRAARGFARGSQSRKRLDSEQRQRDPAFFILPARTETLASVVARLVPASLGEHIPAEEAVIRGRARQGVRVAGQDFVTDCGQPLAEHLADV